MGWFVGVFLLSNSLGAARSPCTQSSALLNSAFGMLVHVLSGSAAMRGSISPVALAAPGGERGFGRAGLGAPGRTRPEGLPRAGARPAVPPARRGISPPRVPWGASAGSAPPVRPGPRLCGGGGAGQGSLRGSAEPGPREGGGRRGQHSAPRLPSLGEPSNLAEVPLMRRPAVGIPAARADFLGA